MAHRHLPENPTTTSSLHGTSLRSSDPPLPFPELPLPQLLAAPHLRSSTLEPRTRPDQRRLCLSPTPMPSLPPAALLHPRVSSSPLQLAALARQTFSVPRKSPANWEPRRLPLTLSTSTRPRRRQRRKLTASLNLAMIQKPKRKLPQTSLLRLPT